MTDGGATVVTGPPVAAPIITLEGASKRFGALTAMDRVDLTVRAGECLALVGHNGAGKSTLVNLVTRLFPPTEGRVDYPGSDGPAAAGVRAISQEGTLCPNLTVLENVAIAQRSLGGAGWRRTARARITAALGTIFPGNRIRPDALVLDLSLAEQQMVEVGIGFAEAQVPAQLVIMDEPTSSLDAAIAAQLLAHVRRFCAGGGAVMFISHIMGEVFEVATRIVVLRDGRVIADRPAAGFTRDSLVDAMGHVAKNGHVATAAAARALGDKAAAVLRTPEGISARRGEIVGLAGLAGHGQPEALARFYLTQRSDWRSGLQPRAVFVAGDRRRDGIMPIWSIGRNLSLAALGTLTARGLIDRRAEADLGESWRRRVGIRTGSMAAGILSLSGGNQQKVLFARALSTRAAIVVMDDPMRGVDIGTKTEVYEMIRQEAAQGRTFLWYSTEMDELRHCGRVFVFRDGAISAELEGEAITEERILAASFRFGEDAA